MEAAPENKIRFGVLFSERLANLGFANRPLKKSVRDFFNHLLKSMSHESPSTVSLRGRIPYRRVPQNAPSRRELPFTPYAIGNLGPT